MTFALRLAALSSSLLCLAALTAPGLCAADSAQAWPEAAERLRTVRSLRVFAKDPVAESDIQKILLAGQNAPSAMNRQEWHFTAVQNAETLAKVADAVESVIAGSPGAKVPGRVPGMGIASLPVLFVVSGVEGGDINTGLAVQSMNDQAVLLGYDTRIMTFPAMAMNRVDARGFSTLFSVPEGQSIKAVMAVGRFAAPVDGVSRATDRKPFGEVAAVLK